MNRRRLWALAAFTAGALAVASACAVVQPVGSVDRRDPGVAADPARLEAAVRALAETFHPRDYRHPQNLDRAADWIGEELRKTGAAVREQRWDAEGETYRNVIARFGPAGGPLLVVGAHYDAALELPAADDNASGVAGLLELARLLAQKPPPGPVELVAFSLEEPPFFRTDQMGSAVHAASLAKERVAVRAMISLEMIGYFSDAPGSQQIPFAVLRPFYPSEGNFIAVVGDLASASLVRRVKKAMLSASELPVKSINAPVLVPGIDWSDHRSYWQQDFPAVMVTDTAMSRNTAYHTGEDTPDRLDYRRMALVVNGVFAAVQALTAGVEH
jgi:hypothetical protein